MKRKQAFKRYIQRGFTLVELAIVLVIAGIILVGVLKGTDAINKAKVERMVADMRGLQGILLEFEKRNGRLPGDCDNNGALTNSTMPVGPVLLTCATWGHQRSAAIIYDFDPTNRTMPAIAVGAGANFVCIDNTPARESDINLVWNELRRAGIVDANRLPRELARHSMNDVFGVTTMFDASNVGGQAAGAIVVYGIPVWMAEAVDASIDGSATMYNKTADFAFGAASIGRVRIWSGAGGTGMTGQVFVADAGVGSYDQGLNDRDRLIAISFQYTPNKLLQ